MLYFFKWLLFPLLYLLSLLYGGVMLLRNKFFDLGLLPEKEYGISVISIGNITVGGTGKTPLTEYVIGLLKDKHKVALLSRGYKRKTKGALIASADSTAADIGDEPMQIKTKFPEITVAVAEKRTEGIDKLLEKARPEVIVLDDAYQHRYVKPGLSILLIDYNRPLWKDFTFPAGNLREPASGKKRADIIVVSKCPADITSREKHDIVNRIKPGNWQSVFFTTVDYGSPVNVSGSGDFPDGGFKVLAIAGIARPGPFFDLVSARYDLHSRMVFPDHHSFSENDCMRIEDVFNGIDAVKKVIVTTEKDMMRFKAAGCFKSELMQHIWYIPIKSSFLFDDENKFNQIIHRYVEKGKKDSRLSE